MYEIVFYTYFIKQIFMDSSLYSIYQYFSIYESDNRIQYWIPFDF